MALSRIWSAFIIIAVLVGGIRMIGGDKMIFTRMVVGKSSDKYDSVYYYGTGSPLSQKLSPVYADFLKEYGYYRTPDVSKATVLLTDNLAGDSTRIAQDLNPAIKTY